MVSYATCYLAIAIGYAFLSSSSDTLATNRCYLRSNQRFNTGIILVAIATQISRKACQLETD